MKKKKIARIRYEVSDKAKEDWEWRITAAYRIVFEAVMLDRQEKRTKEGLNTKIRRDKS